MTSQINPANIDENYPIAGRDNSSQGFRTNFAVIKDNFTYAENEISDMQSKVIVKAALTGDGTPLATVNDMDGAPLRNAEILGFRETIYDIGAITGSESIDISLGSYQTVELAGSVTIAAFTGWPDSGVQSRFRLEVYVPNTSYTLTLPTSVSLNYEYIANINSRTITFTDTGFYIFEFSTNDSGVTISVQDLNRNRNTVQGNLYIQGLLAGVPGNAISFTVEEIGGQLVGNIIANNILAGSLINTGVSSLSLTGNLTAGNLIANANIYGTIMTPVQSNITLLGTLSSLSVSGNANVGNLTVTNFTDMCGGTGYGVQYVAAVNGSSTTIANNTGILILNPAGVIASHTVIMPSSPMNGQAVKIAFGDTITSLTHTVSGGQTLKGALTSGSVTGGGEWVYYAANSTWFKTS